MGETTGPSGDPIARVTESERKAIKRNDFGKDEYIRGMLGVADKLGTGLLAQPCPTDAGS